MLSNHNPSPAVRARRWLAKRTRRLSWLRRVAQWQARQDFLPYNLRFRFARWVNLLTLDAGLPSVVAYQDKRTGLQFDLNLNDAVPRATYYFGIHQPDVVRVSLSLLSRQTCCLEIGAHMGLHTVHFAKQYAAWGETRAVIAFEPCPSNYTLLVSHITRNNLQDVALCYSMAVSDQDGETTLFLSDQPNSGNSSLRDLSAEPTNAQSGASTIVPTVSLDTFWKHPPTNKPVGLIKMDIEGAELLALNGGTKLIEQERPYIIFEAHPIWMRHFNYTFDDLKTFFFNRSYSVYAIQSQGNRLVPAPVALTTAVDCLAIPDERQNAARERLNII
ncbi:MAG: FkbM family methyltransferase [Aggregatilineales bacterium]